MESLNQLSLPQLYKVKQSLHKFFYGIGTNIALYGAISSDKSERFRKKTAKSIEKQINHIATVELISKITETRVKIRDRNLIIAVSLYWLTFDKIFEGGDEALFLFLAWAATQGGESSLDKMIPPPYSFELNNLELQLKLRDRVSFLRESIDNTTVAWVALTIQKGLEKGMINEEIAKFLRKEGRLVALERADLITETEIATAMGMLEYETFKRNGIEKVMWITSEDEKTCEICMVNNRKTVVVGEKFPSGHLYPILHLRCRCYLLPVLPTVIEQQIWRGT